ncbi:diacylglycerol kinase family protein [Lentibacillus sp. Marseille-P4043]|uniref:diacylglycerol kinase family protein n=1 Tax=Lentibacillus sp. Marseille-P4043 TaxID=2040293 RepID=UPI000D0B26E1|nr:diacylglycerol kinase family protein [Lentibacillus sp. Marseille-P4043]
MRLGSNDNQKKRGIGIRYAWNGLVEVLKTERNFQIHTVTAIIIIGVSFLLQLNVVEWAIILFSIGFVFVAEMTNTAIERIIDYVKPDIHPIAKAIKDIAAGSVLVAALIAVIIGFIIFLPKLYRLFMI